MGNAIALDIETVLPASFITVGPGRYYESRYGFLYVRTVTDKAKTNEVTYLYRLKDVPDAAWDERTVDLSRFFEWLCNNAVKAVAA